MARVYVVEDDENIRELVSYALGRGGFQAFSFENAELFYKALHGESLPDLILLDIMLPKEDGLSIIKRLKQSSKWMDIPVIMVTAKGSELDKVKGLDLGADDYVTKPFSVLELMSRINAVLRRIHKPDDQLQTYKDIVLDQRRHSVSVKGEAIQLTLKEHELLHYLIKNEGLVLTRDKLIESVWGYEYEGESRTIDMHIKTLRQKLGPAGEYIKTIRGLGYKLE